MFWLRLVLRRPNAIFNAPTTYVGNLGGLDPSVYTICMTTPSEPFSNHDWTDKLQDSITRFPTHNNICFFG